MKKALSLLFLFCIVSAYSQTGTKNYIDQNYIEVTGKAEIEVVPNQIYLKIIIAEKEIKGKTTIEELEKSMIRSLTEIGLDPIEDIAIKDMASNFKSYWVKNSEIQTTKEYQVLCRDANKAGEVFRELESLGISNITIERVYHSEIQELRHKVKIEAIIAAKKKAQSLANAIEQNIGKAIFIQELNFQPYRGNPGAASNIIIKGYLDEVAVVDPTIEFEKIKLDYSIVVRFELN